MEPGDDPRPLQLPTPDAVVAWWCSGSTDEEQIICAVIDLAPIDDGVSPEACLVDLLATWWSPSSFRFIEQKPDGWMPNPGRFPVKGGAT